MGLVDIAYAMAQAKKKRPPASWSPSTLATSYGASPTWSPTTTVPRSQYQPTSIAERRSYTPVPTPLKRKEKEETKKERRTKASARRPSLLERLDRPFAPGETITPRQTALLAEAHGLPGITYAKAIVPGESGYQPGIRNPDDNTPSLFQITPSVQSAATKAKFDKIASKHKGGYSNPVAAAKQAAFLAGDSADEGISNYVAYNPSAPQGHLPGGPARARKKLEMPAKSIGPKPPSSRALGKFLPGGDPIDYRKVDPKLLRKVVKVARESGDPIDINSGYRTREEQEAAYADYQAGGNLAAVPGTSKHEFGQALDLDLTDAQRALLPEYGLGLPVPGENWHVELTEDNGYSASGGGGFAAGAAGGTSYSPSSPGGAVASGIQQAAQSRSIRGRAPGLSTLPFAARAARPRVGDEEEEIDPLTGEPIQKRYRPRRRRG